MPCSFEHESALREQGIFFAAGIDEAGRGPLAGPVVAAAVVFCEQKFPDGLDDSKKLTPKRRDAIFAVLTSSAHVRWAVSVQEASVIDRINILRATHLAMAEAFSRLPGGAVHALIDGLPVPSFPAPQTALVGGDGLSLSIAAASVIAKVTRDRIMDRHDAEYPQYGFSRHKGYGTREHLAALREHGPSPIHRRSFAPVAQAELF
ncbi:MAG TPA: ribonuclease HII [Terrimicrobiaceae bacterium]|nr:ribonuclease HII [Terrimicrobiaceae bacterium]